MFYIQRAVRAYPYRVRYFIQSQILCFVSIAAIMLGISTTANAAHVTIKFSGETNAAFFSREMDPYLGIGDAYSGQLTFDLANDGAVSNVGGSAVINGYNVDFSNYNGVISTSVAGVETEFGFTSFGGGAGEWNIDRIRFRANSNITGALGPSGYNISRLTFSGARNYGTGTGFRYVYEEGPTVAIDVSVVPLPAALPLYGAGLVIVGLVGRRYKKRLSAS